MASEAPSLDGQLAERIAEATPVGMAVVTAPGTLSWANAAYFTLTGRDPSMVGIDIHSIPESDGTWSPAVRRAVDEALGSGTPATFTSVRARHRDPQHPVFFDVEVQRLRASGDGPAQVLLRISDVTERVQEHERADLFYASFLASTNPMQLTDAKGIMVDVNPAYERTYGYTRAECIGRAPNLVRSRYTPPEVYEQLWQALRDPERGSWSGEILNRDRMGRERPVLLSITAIREGTSPPTHYLGVAVDLSEKRSWELGVAHAERLASLGQLAAGVAHEINTPLANVLLISESLRRKSQDPWVLARLDRLTDQVEAAARIVRGLLEFARRDPPRPAEIDLVEVVRAGVEFLRGKQSEDVEIEIEHPDGGVPILGDRGQLIQVLTNLLNNAYDAMNGHGTIRIGIRTRADRAVLEVTDSGPGIPEQALPHIFEPFFTTKPEGSGTGLGLAICHGIVQAHHGSIEASNLPGPGAMFRVTLPLRSAPRPAPAGGPDGPVKPA
jgi:PAS domain S-box-containing protein